MFYKCILVFVSFVLFVVQIKRFMGYLLYKNESYEIVGAIIAVQKELGCGYLERVYQDALEY